MVCLNLWLATRCVKNVGCYVLGRHGMGSETAAPSRNFTLATDERVRALVAGPPAYLRRLRAIEDLEGAVARALGSEEHQGRARALLAKLNDLVSRHNRYYPIEANLRIDPRTGELIDRDGRPWRPMELRTLATFG